MHGASIGFDI